MKKRILFLMLYVALGTFYVSGQSCVINLCELEPVNKVFKDTLYNDAMKISFSSALISLEPVKRKNYTVIASSMKNYRITPCHYHPFIEVVHTAYANHRPISLSPDMIWLLICQGFANHVNENTDSLRKYFVDFEGKKVIKIYRDHLPVNTEWEGVVSDFNSEITKYTGEELTSTVVSKFSTTTSIEETAYRITVMDAMSQYFVYSMGITCGIPQITLEGTTEDWENVLEKAKILKKYELSWWIDDLIPILEEFVNASKGKINLDFWEKIHSSSKDGCSGKEFITGWVNTFFPYINEAGKMVKNKGFKRPLTPGSGQVSNHYKMGISKAEVYLVLDNGDINQLELLGGFVGMKQENYTLRPEIGWLIRDRGDRGIKEKDNKYEKEIKE